MKNTLSSNYFFKRYSYYIYLIICSILILKLEKQNWIFTSQDIKYFIVVTFLFFLWIFIFGSFHFNEQAKVSRIDYQTLQFVKGRRSFEITKSNIDQIYIQKINNHKMGQRWYKVLLITNDSKKFRFTYVSKLANFSNLSIIENFLNETENFWGLADKSRVRESPNFFFCN